MQYTGELISIAVAVSWTVTALFIEQASRQIGSLVVNVIRMVFSFLLIGGLLFFTTGSFIPQLADGATWFWMILSGLVGFVFGDLCLFYSYTLITSRFSQLIMTLAPPFAALSGWLMLGETMRPLGIVGMVLTLGGIAVSIFNRPQNGEKLKLKLPLRGILFALGGALGQGVGIVLSKKGMLYYEMSAAGNEAVSEFIPFAATQIRVITGFVGFTAIVLLSGRWPKLKEAFRNRKALSNTFWGSFFGPAVGVSLSLMAVLYTSAGIASTIMATVPILILIPYRLLYKQRISWPEIAGAFVSVCGVALFFL
jgi:Predicted membrane protein